MTRHSHPNPSPSTPPEDRALLQFLQDHAAAPPPPAPELEDRIMTAIRAEPLDLGATTTVPLWQQRVIWVPTAMAAGVAVVWIAMQGLISPEPVLTVAEQAELEMFLERAWSGAVEEADGADLTI